MRLPAALLLIAALAPAPVVAACGEEPSSDGPVVDVRAGTVDAAGLGRPLALVQKRFGPGTPLGPNDEHGPRKGEPEELGLPWVVATSSASRSLAYDDLHVYAGEDDDVNYLAITRNGTHTREGVRIGDDLDAVEDAYDGADCGIRNEDTEYVEYPYCKVRVRPGRVVWFGQDPIRSIVVTSVAIG